MTNELRLLIATPLALKSYHYRQWEIFSRLGMATV